jgi:hypothetical protein
LQAFCRQYPRWKVELTGSAEISGMHYDGMPHSPQPGDPTEKAVERRESLLRKIELIEGCARDVDGGAWARALVLNVCNGMGWEVVRDLHPDALKNSQREAYFHARRSFFRLLDERKD